MNVEGLGLTAEKSETLRQEFEFKLRELASTVYISDKMLNVGVMKRQEVAGVLAVATLKALTQEVETVAYPADWWQALKARWYPGWMKRLAPVRYTRHTFVRYCPHLGDRDVLHTSWLSFGDASNEHAAGRGGQL